jgi:integrase
MASIRQDPASKVYRISFRFGGKQYQKSLETTDETEANAALGRIELVLRELKTGRKTLPEGAEFWTFLFTDGQRTQRLAAPTVVTLGEMFDRYEQEMPAGAMEGNSLDTHRHHSKHLLRVLGKKTPVQTLTVTELQRYVTKRSGEKKKNGDPYSSETIKKEVKRFKAVWNWAREHGIVTAEVPTRRLRYEKGEESLPFQTWEEIEKRIALSGLTGNAVAEQWETLFLRKEESAKCLEHVRQADLAPFVYPMFVFVAHTGARRSEMTRSRVEDFDFESKEVTIREKKRDRTVKETRRRVPMTATLERVMREWLGPGHPGGPYAFCHEEVVKRSKKRSRTTGHQSGPSRPTTMSDREATVQERPGKRPPGHLTLSEATHHFKRALAGSKWAVVRGFHVFRHSFASNLAAVGKDKDVINAWMGHQTDEMRRRYRHLFPEETRSALNDVFD